MELVNTKFHQTTHIYLLIVPSLLHELVPEFNAEEVEVEAKRKSQALVRPGKCLGA